MVFLRRVCLAFVAAVPLLQAAPQSDGCSDMAYEDHNQIDYVVSTKTGTLRGVVVDFGSDPVPKACVGIFTEDAHALLAKAESNDEGEFAMPRLVKGSYRIVVRYPGFCAANAILRVHGGLGHRKALSVQMRPRGLDTCSYIDRK